MKTDYITASSTLPPYLAYPRFLLGMDLRLITKEVYCILLDMTVNDEASVDKHGRRYLTFINPEIAKLIDRTPSTVGHALAELERVGLVKRHWVSRTPVNANWKMSFFAGMGCHFLAVSMRWVCSLDYPLLVGLKPVKS